MKDENLQKKYSKISPALKCYFLHSLYYRCMTIKDAASRCKLNYSTAKVIIRDLSLKERKYVKRIIKLKELHTKKNKRQPQMVCGFRDLVEKEEPQKEFSQSQKTEPPKCCQRVQLISRVGFDFFAKEEKRQ